MVSNSKKMVRAGFLGLCAAVALGVSGCCSKSCCAKPCHVPAKKTCAVAKAKGALKMLKNEDFYADGKLDVAKVKQAYYDLMTSFKYPIVDRLKTDEFWVCDFQQGEITKLGMGGIFWMNVKGTYGDSGVKQYQGEFKDVAYGYLGHDIYLLPNQVLPEHSHIGGSEGYGPKMEAWQVRHGVVRFFSECPSEGAKLISELPENERPWGYGEAWYKGKYYVEKKPGEVVVMADPQSWHGQQAGPDGAIVTEYGTYHNHVHFSKPGMEFKNTGDK